MVARGGASRGLVERSSTEPRRAQPLVGKARSLKPRRGDGADNGHGQRPSGASFHFVSVPGVSLPSVVSPLATIRRPSGARSCGQNR